MKRRGAVQTAIWIALGVGAFLFLNSRGENVEREAAVIAAAPRDSALTIFRLDSIPKPFKNLKPPRLVAPRALTFKPRPERLRAAEGDPVTVSVTAYCLKGNTRSGRPTREGIVAADARVFPLNSEIELKVGGRPAGRYRVEDTGLLIKGHTIDIWLPNCSEARSFGRKRGIATLVTKIRR